MRFLLNQLPASKTTKGNYLVVDNPYNTPRFWQHWRAILQCPLDLRKIFGVAKKFLKLRSFLFQTQENP